MKEQKHEDYNHRIATLERKVENLEQVAYHPKVTIYSQNALKQTTMFDVPLNQFLNLLLDFLGLDYEGPKELKGRLFKKRKAGIKHPKGESRIPAKEKK